MKKGNQKKVPELRFPGFEGEWNDTTLRSLSKDGFSNGVFNDPNKIGHGYSLINVKDIYVGDEIDTETLSKVAISQNEFEKNKALKGDIFFTRSSLVKEGIAHSNYLAVDAEDITFDGHLIKMTPNEELVIPRFLSYLLKSPYVRRQLIARGKSATMTTIGQEDIASVKLNIPNKPEQEKIANLLHWTNKLLELVRKQKANLELHKKTLLQKIFSQEIRFKDENGEDFPEWEMQKISTIFEVKSFSSKSKNQCSDGRYFIVDMGSISKEGRLIANKRTNELLDPLMQDDLVMPKDDIGGGNIIGKVALIKQNDQYSCGDHVYRLRAKIGYAKYLYYAINSPDISSQLRKKANGTAQLGLSIGAVTQQIVQFPCQKEQIIIADVLNYVDSTIDDVSESINYLTSWKKGLLVKLFP